MSIHPVISHDTLTPTHTHTSLLHPQRDAGRSRRSATVLIPVKPAHRRLIYVPSANTNRGFLPHRSVHQRADFHLLPPNWDPVPVQSLTTSCLLLNIFSPPPCRSCTFAVFWGVFLELWPALLYTAPPWCAAVLLHLVLPGYTRKNTLRLWTEGVCRCVGSSITEP